MLREFLQEEEAATALEYILVAALVVAVLISAAWALMDAIADKGEEARTSLDSQIPTPP